MKNDVALGANRTGIALHPDDEPTMLEISDQTVPSTEGDEALISEARGEYIDRADLIGSVPLPATEVGIAATGVAAVKGINLAALVDKLGERLAFERMGVRLYEALLDKCERTAPLPGGPRLEDLQTIQGEELAHFELLSQAMTSLGADPTALTPSADLGAVAAHGLLQVITDARTTLRQSLEALLVVELTDNDGWELLAELARHANKDDLADRFEEASRREEEHLRSVRRWVRDSVTALAEPALDSLDPKIV